MARICGQKPACKKGLVLPPSQGAPKGGPLGPPRGPAGSLPEGGRFPGGKLTPPPAYVCPGLNREGGKRGLRGIPGKRDFPPLPGGPPWGPHGAPMGAPSRTPTHPSPGGPHGGPMGYPPPRGGYPKKWGILKGGPGPLRAPPDPLGGLGKGDGLVGALPHHSPSLPTQPRVPGYHGTPTPPPHLLGTPRGWVPQDTPKLALGYPGGPTPWGSQGGGGEGSKEAPLGASWGTPLGYPLGPPWGPNAQPLRGGSSP